MAVNENIPQYGDILYLVNILNEECEEYKIIEVTQNSSLIMGNCSTDAE